MKIGLIREGKNPPDKRVPFSPPQCKTIQHRFKAEVVVQSSNHRAFTDDEYREAGIEIVDDISDCDVIMGIKEVPIDMLVPNKKHFFFSHTFKKQVHNRKLLQAFLEKKITMIDYELLTDENGTRLTAFGRYAGVVGAFKALRGWGLMHELYDLKPAHKCRDRAEMDGELDQVELEKPIKIVVTGTGRVAHGAREVLDRAGVHWVSPAAFLSQTFTESVYTDLSPLEYNHKIDGTTARAQEFYRHPDRFESSFSRYSSVADIYIACHYWDNKAPHIIKVEDYLAPDFKIKMIADISCDLNGPIASTLRSSVIEDPFYGYDPVSRTEVPFATPGSIGVMAVDNLPCELPRDASVDFGHALIEKVLPQFFNDDLDEILERATETADGKLTERFSYLQDFVDGK
jgi:saccharopine dehydrogenase (NAD+, L-lysine-forming)